MKHLRLFIFLAFVFVTLPLIAEEVKIDTDFPGGNIKVISIDGDNVKLAQDLRDTEGRWFYWSFRIRGAEERTLHFTLPGVVGARGPAVSYDGINWHWLSDKAGFSADKFDYTFKQDEKEVYFSQCINYTEKNLNLFLEKYKNNPALKVESLCKSEKGRNVELLRIGSGKDTPFKVFLSSRHHCGETMGTYAMEGIIETILSDTEDGKWLREHCDFFMVPLVDKDGVEDGDQGKNRKPYDHNRDYIQRKYNSVKAITEQVPKWLDGKPLFFLDLHCPNLRGGADPLHIEKGTNEYFYFVGQNTGEKLTKSLQRYGEILEKERKGTIPFKAINTLPFGKSWNNAANFSKKDMPLLSCAQWGTTLPNTVFSGSTEIPFANAEGAVVDADSARKLGNDLARTIRIYLETLPLFAEEVRMGVEVNGMQTVNINETIESVLRDFSKKYSLSGGIAMAISSNERLVYAGAIGYADKQHKIPLTPEHRMRIASVSKPITSIAIMKLAEEKKLTLNDEVFGETGILGDEYGVPEYENRPAKITVKQLLEHTAGGWANGKKDPMFVIPNVRGKEFVQTVIKQYPLEHSPGTKYAYSNFGYCVLGRVIEKVSGMTYENYAKKHILTLCGINGMRIGGNVSDPDEVEYIGDGNPYSVSPLHMDAHGGWIANPIELLKLLVRIDGFSNVPDILKDETIKTMTTPSAQNKGYALGWMVNDNNNWWHTGALPGTATEMARSSEGFNWVILINFRPNAPDFNGDLDQLFWKIKKIIQEWPTGTEL